MKTIWNGHIIRPSVELCAFRVFYQQIAFYSDCVLIKSKNVLQFVGMIRAIDLHAPIKTSNDMEMQRYTEHESHNNSTDVINIMVKIGNEFASLAAKAALSSNAIANKKQKRRKNEKLMWKRTNWIYGCLSSINSVLAPSIVHMALPLVALCANAAS